MSDLPEYSVAELELEDRFDVAEFDNDDAVDLGLAAVEVIDERGLNLAVRIVLRGDTVFQAKLGATGPGNDEWLAGKAAVAARFGESSLLVRRRHEQSGSAFEPTDGVERLSGGAVPILSQGVVIGTITCSGEPDAVDHATVREAIRRYLSR